MDRPVLIGDPARPPCPPNPDPAVPRRRVVVVDDDEVSVHSLALILRLEGYDVRVAFDGESALEVVAGFRPEAVLSE